MKLLVYAVLRAVVELFRGDYAVRATGGWITPGQSVSVLILVAGGILYWRLSSARSTPARR